MSTLRPFNLRTGQYGPVYVGITPEEAVIAAQAQELKDWNTWDYPQRYAGVVVRNDRTVTCGNWTIIS